MRFKRSLTLVASALLLALLAVALREPRLQYRVDAERHIHRLILREGDHLYSLLLDADRDGDGVADLIADVGLKGGRDWWRSIRHQEELRHPRSSRVTRISGQTGVFLANWSATPDTVFELLYGEGDEVHVHQEGWHGERPCLTHHSCVGGEVNQAHQSYAFTLDGMRAKLHFEAPSAEGLMGHREGWDLVFQLGDAAAYVLEEDAWPSEFLINESLLHHGVILQASHSLPRMGQHVEWVEVIDLARGERQRFWIPESDGEFRMDAEGAWARINADGLPALGVLHFDDDALVAKEFALGEEVQVSEVARFERLGSGALRSTANRFEVAHLQGRPVFLHLASVGAPSPKLVLRLQLPDQQAIEHELPGRPRDETSQEALNIQSLQWASSDDQDGDGMQDLLVTIHANDPRVDHVTWVLLSGATGAILPR